MGKISKYLDQLVDPATLSTAGRYDLFTAPSGEEWQLVGTCGGPKLLMPEGVAFLEGNPDRRGKELPQGCVRWLFVGRGEVMGASLSDDEYEKALAQPDMVLQWQPGDMDPMPVERSFLEAFRKGCNNTFYLPTAELTGHGPGNEKAIRCRMCRSYAVFSGTPPPESKNFKKA